LCDVDGFSTFEAAHRLAITRAELAVRLHRARQTLLAR
jgi:DNA-directed RNA polymerase specialized sigma24 family protein